MKGFLLLFNNGLWICLICFNCLFILQMLFFPIASLWYSCHLAEIYFFGRSAFWTKIKYHIWLTAFLFMVYTKSTIFFVFQKMNLSCFYCFNCLILEWGPHLLKSLHVSDLLRSTNKSANFMSDISFCFSLQSKKILTLRFLRFNVWWNFVFGLHIKSFFS